jgi:sterol desaturase/sphingolipid hydroxylase (fatty acid hydroxylase superfamily)|tara:strand:- start:1991 stop:2857 length:867 start_codon:yes stop_codon:yes gene_type:complete
VTISPATQQWFQMLSIYGWIWLIPIVERLIPLKGQRLIRPGMVNDLIHTYHRFHLWTMLNAVLASWLITYAQTHEGQGPYLRGALIDAHWSLNFIAILFFGHVTFYASHYACHKVPMLWQFHRVHHSSVYLDSFSTSRFHVIDKTLFAAPYLMLVTYFQPDPGMVFLFITFNDFWGRYGHGNIKDPHWLGYFMSNPKFHRWHHSNHPDAIDKNFSAEFNFLDWIFGTAYYPKEQVPEDFGSGEYSNNIIVQHYQPFLDCYNIVKADGWMALLRKPQDEPLKHRPTLGN